MRSCSSPRSCFAMPAYAASRISAWPKRNASSPGKSARSGRMNCFCTSPTSAPATPARSPAASAPRPRRHGSAGPRARHAPAHRARRAPAGRYVRRRPPRCSGAASPCRRPPRWPPPAARGTADCPPPCPGSAPRSPGRGRGRPLQERAGVSRGERLERDHGRVALWRGPAGTQLEQLRTRQADDEERRPGREGDHVVDEVEQCRIGPVDVVDDHDQRPFTGNRLEELAHRPRDLPRLRRLVAQPHGGEHARERSPRPAPRPRAAPGSSAPGRRRRRGARASRRTAGRRARRRRRRSGRRRPHGRRRGRRPARG